MRALTLPSITLRVCTALAALISDPTLVIARTGVGGLELEQHNDNSLKLDS